MSIVKWLFCRWLRVPWVVELNPEFVTRVVLVAPQDIGGGSGLVKIAAWCQSAHRLSQVDDSAIGP
ncbi:hypothetical protein SBA4_2110004 [Candidatus Sulfopaludibacter sp. SbA4]|nr:hypothetical protein SBA4_2110004 [Candidatus Sulfopaludibacter sp. SbA4]